MTGGVPRRRSTVLVRPILVLFASLLGAGCGRGVAPPIDGATAVSFPVDDAPTTAPVLRHSPAPAAVAAKPLPDPRCRAVRTLFLQAAVDPRPASFVVTPETERLLDQAEVLASGQSKADVDAVRELVVRFRRNPASVTAADTAASTARMNRLLTWAVTTCPPLRPVWGCATQVSYGEANVPLVVSEVDGAQLTPDDAVVDRFGELSGTRIELVRTRNQVVFGYLDGFRLVRRRIAVARADDLWYVVSASMCDDPHDLPDPLAPGVTFVEELPDVGDGPQYAPTTTTPVAGPGVPTTGPLAPCRYDPSNTSDQYQTLGDYMANGPAEPGCWSLLTAAGKACMQDPPSGDLFACFDL